MMRQIIIGREGNQPFPIVDEYVSRQHAVFMYDDATGMMTITDKSRLGIGTFVRMGNQYQQVSQCNVDPTTEVRLGPYFTFKIGQLFQMSSVKSQSLSLGQKKKQEKVDIADLRMIAEKYEETKIKLEQKQANINSLRSLTLVGSLAGGGISAIIGGQEWYWHVIGPVIAVIFCISLMLYCSISSKNIITNKNRNEKSFKISFCCPKCHVPFVGKLYENILAEGKCPKCKIEFYDSKI